MLGHGRGWGGWAGWQCVAWQLQTEQCSAGRLEEAGLAEVTKLPLEPRLCPVLLS